MDRKRVLAELFGGWIWFALTSGPIRARKRAWSDSFLLAGELSQMQSDEQDRTVLVSSGGSSSSVGLGSSANELEGSPPPLPGSSISTAEPFLDCGRVDMQNPAPKRNVQTPGQPGSPHAQENALGIPLSAIDKANEKGANVSRLPCKMLHVGESIRTVVDDRLRHVTADHETSTLASI